MLRKSVRDELELLRRRHKGVLHPKHVVEFAADPNTALHSRFQWDDSKAAAAFRLEQARSIIRLHVTVISEKTGPVRALVSLSSDRKTGGGYRAMVEVLDHKQASEQLIRDALMELNQIKAKYEKIRTLRPIWEAMGKVQRAVAEQRERKAA